MQPIENKFRIATLAWLFRHASLTEPPLLRNAQHHCLSGGDLSWFFWVSLARPAASEAALSPCFTAQPLTGRATLRKPLPTSRVACDRHIPGLQTKRFVGVERRLSVCLRMGARRGWKLIRSTISSQDQIKLLPCTTGMPQECFAKAEPAGWRHDRFLPQRLALPSHLGCL